MKEKITRRDALKKLGQLGMAAAGAGSFPFILEKEAVFAAADKPKIVVGKGGNLYGRLQNVLKELGGIERFVKKGSKVMLKPNIGWARNPEQAANTNPDLVFYVAKMCYSAGAKEVKIYENPCDNYTSTFDMSGIKDAAERAGVKLFAASSEGFYDLVDVPRGKMLKKVLMVKYLREADCVINMPIAKNHSAATLTLGMKNFMGSIYDRGYWHTAGLNQCIADFMTLVKPQLTILDATRILTTGGPKGPGKVTKLDTLVAGSDFVAVDSYGATLFGKKGLDIPHIKIADSMKLGHADLSAVNIVKV